MLKKIPNKLLMTSGSVLGKIIRKFGYKIEKPIFIVGTGRCGSSLLVHLLDSHPNLVSYPGEANKLWHPALYPVNNYIEPIEVDPECFTDYSINKWPSNQSDKIKNIFNFYHFLVGKHKQLFIKSAMISFMIPKILDIFPDARFIHIYRNAPSVVLSYYRKNYGKYGNFTCTQEEYFLLCSRYWNKCIMEIEKQRRGLVSANSDAFLEFSYEHLCSKPNEILKKLAYFFNVDSNFFTYDTSKIKSHDYKKKDMDDKLMDLVLNETNSTMKKMGYIE